MRQLHKEALCAFLTLVHHTGEWGGGALEERGLSTAGKTSTLQRDGDALAPSQKTTVPLHQQYSDTVTTIQ